MDRLRKALSARSAAHSPRGATRRDNNKYELTEEQRQNQRAAQPTESEVRQAIFDALRPIISAETLEEKVGKLSVIELLLIFR